MVLRHYGVPTCFNYGMIPQTWENDKIEDRETGCFGDADPLDVVDLSNKDLLMLSMPRLKILGSLCLLDQNELDWKILAVEEEFSKEFGVRSIEKLNQYTPGAVSAIREWFRTIKTYDGKPENHFGRGEKVLGLDETLEII